MEKTTHARRRLKKRQQWCQVRMPSQCYVMRVVGKVRYEMVSMGIAIRGVFYRKVCPPARRVEGAEGACLWRPRPKSVSCMPAAECCPPTARRRDAFVKPVERTQQYGNKIRIAYASGVVVAVQWQ